MSGKITNPQTKNQITFGNLEQSGPPSSTTFKSQASKTQTTLNDIKDTASSLSQLAQTNGKLTQSQAQQVVELTQDLRDSTTQFAKDHEQLLNIAVSDQNTDEAKEAIKAFYPAAQVVSDAANATAQLSQKGLDSALNDSGLSNQVQSSVASSIDAANLAGRNNTFTTKEGTVAPDALKNPLSTASSSNPGLTATSGSGSLPGASSGTGSSGSGSVAGTTSGYALSAADASKLASSLAGPITNLVAAILPGLAGSSQSASSPTGTGSSGGSSPSSSASSSSNSKSTSQAGSNAQAATSSTPAGTSNNQVAAGSGTPTTQSASGNTDVNPQFTPASKAYPAPSQSDISQAIKSQVPGQSQSGLDTMSKAVQNAVGTGQLNKVPSSQTVLTAIQNTHVPGVSWDQQYAAAGVVQGLYAKGAAAAAGGGTSNTATAGTASSAASQASVSAQKQEVSKAQANANTAAATATNSSSSTATASSPSSSSSAGALKPNASAIPPITLGRIINGQLDNKASSDDLDKFSNAVYKSIGSPPKMPTKDQVFGALQSTGIKTYPADQLQKAAGAVVDAYANADKPTNSNPNLPKSTQSNASPATTTNPTASSNTDALKPNTTAIPPLTLGTIMRPKLPNVSDGDLQKFSNAVYSSIGSPPTKMPTKDQLVSALQGTGIKSFSTSQLQDAAGAVVEGYAADKASTASTSAAKNSSPATSASSAASATGFSISGLSADKLKEALKGALPNVSDGGLVTLSNDIAKAIPNPVPYVPTYSQVLDLVSKSAFTGLTQQQREQAASAVVKAYSPGASTPR